MSELTYPATVQYTKEHTWLRVESDGTAYVGITDFAQDQLGEVAFVDLPSAGAEFAAGAEFGTVESIKSVSALYMPINGTVIAVNDELSSAPSTVNVGPYTDGWMLHIKLADNADRSLLLSAADYQAGLA